MSSIERDKNFFCDNICCQSLIPSEKIHKDVFLQHFKFVNPPFIKIRCIASIKYTNRVI